MKSLRYLFLTVIACSCFAQEPVPTEGKIEIIPAVDKEICISTKGENTTSLFSNPGNNPIEILRRIGRLISPLWPREQNTFIAGTVFFEKFVGTPNFVKSFSTQNLSPRQQEFCKNQLDSHEKMFEDLLKDFNTASTSIKIKSVFNLDAICNSFTKVVEAPLNASSSISLSDLEKIKTYTLPILGMIKELYTVSSISEQGIYSQTFIETKENESLSKLVSLNKLTIKKYIDEKPLIVLAQTHRIENTSETMKGLMEIPNMTFINQMVASAGLDFEKDILSNYAQESIIYINLTPTGEFQIPDIRWVALVPQVEKLVSILPKLKNLCVQAGILIAYEKSKLEDASIIKLSHSMMPQYGVYAALQDRFCLLSATQEGAVEALKHLKSLSGNGLSENSISEKINDSNFYCRIKTSELNEQLQLFLQSPLMANQGIPPISNLTIFNDTKDIELCTIATDKIAKIIFSIPFVKKEGNKK